MTNDRQLIINYSLFAATSLHWILMLRTTNNSASFQPIPANACFVLSTVAQEFFLRPGRFLLPLVEGMFLSDILFDVNTVPAKFLFSSIELIRRIGCEHGDFYLSSGISFNSTGKKRESCVDDVLTRLRDACYREPLRYKSGFVAFPILWRQFPQ